MIEQIRDLLQNLFFVLLNKVKKISVVKTLVFGGFDYNTVANAKNVVFVFHFKLRFGKRQNCSHTVFTYSIMD